MKYFIFIFTPLFTLAQYGGKPVLSSNTDTPQHPPALILASPVEFSGLIAYSYQVVRGEDDPVIVNKPIYLIYNSSFCKLSIGGIVTYFDIDPSYTRTYLNGIIVESFINADAETVRHGWYNIHIEHNKAGTSSILINMPMLLGGCAYIIDKAKVYSENGQVNDRVRFNDWNDLESKAKESKFKTAKRLQKTPPYYCGARATVNIDSFITINMVSKYKIDSNRFIGEFGVTLNIDSTGRIMATNFGWSRHATNLGFSSSQESVDKSGYVTYPLTEKQYSDQILSILNNLPYFEAAKDYNNQHISVNCMATFHIGAKE